MNRLLPFLSAVIIFFSSCATTKTQSGTLTYFQADSTVFNDTTEVVHTIRYISEDGLAPSWPTIELLPGEINSVRLHGPTTFMQNSAEFIAFPGDSVYVSIDSGSYQFHLYGAGLNRNNEVKVFEQLQALEEKPSFQYLLNNSYTTILSQEVQLKKEIIKSDQRSRFLLDSLCQEYNVGKQFYETVSRHQQNNYNIYLLMFYEIYRDSLVAHDVYESKLRSLLPVCNSVAQNSEFNLHLQYFTKQIYSDLYPGRGIWNTNSIEKFKTNFDNIATNFSGLARAYLLGRLMYSAAFKDFHVSRRYKRRFRRLAKNKTYWAVVSSIFEAQKQLAKNIKKKKFAPNVLLELHSKSNIQFESLLERYKGKFVLVDLWASWCTPCIKEMPALRTLSRELPSEKIVFLSISLDTDITSWRNRALQMPVNRIEQYLLLNKQQTQLYQQLQISTIPRYILFNPEGTLVHSNLPEPSDPELRRILNTLMEH